MKLRSNIASVMMKKLLHGFIPSFQNAVLRVLFFMALILLFMNSGNSITVIHSLDAIIRSSDLIFWGKIKAIENGPILTFGATKAPIEFVSIHIDVKEIYKVVVDKEYVELIYPAVHSGRRINTYVPKTIRLRTWDDSKLDQGIMIEDEPVYPSRVGREWIWLLNEPKIAEDYYRWGHFLT